MESFNYIDIFATKGIEYLLVLGFLLLLTIYWKVLMRPAQRNPLPALASHDSAQGWFQMQSGLYYHPGHTWARPMEGSVVRVGLDDFAQKLVGKVDRFELPPAGATLEQGEKAMALEVQSRAIPVLSPVGGKVVNVNEEVLRSPALVNEDPYGRGWLFEVQAPRLRAHTRNLLTGRVALSWMEVTVESLRRLAAPSLGAVMQDGGLPVSGIALNMSPQRWEEVIGEFLLSRDSDENGEGITRRTS